MGVGELPVVGELGWGCHRTPGHAHPLPVARDRRGGLDELVAEGAAHLDGERLARAVAEHPVRTLRIAYVREDLPGSTWIVVVARQRRLERGVLRLVGVEEAEWHR